MKDLSNIFDIVVEVEMLLNNYVSSRVQSSHEKNVVSMASSRWKLDISLCTLELHVDCLIEIIWRHYACLQEENPQDEELQTQLLKRTVPLNDGAIGYVFTCTKNGPVATWRCHVCNFVDTWRRLKAHVDTQWHEDNMSKYQHSRSNFTKVENSKIVNYETT